MPNRNVIDLVVVDLSVTMRKTKWLPMIHPRSSTAGSAQTNRGDWSTSACGLHDDLLRAGGSHRNVVQVVIPLNLQHERTSVGNPFQHLTQTLQVGHLLAVDLIDDITHL
jgi:hypothetical protein